MKKLIYTLALSTLLWSCGGGGGSDTPPPAPENHTPTTPILGNPTNDLYCLDNVLDFDWIASTDSDNGDVITYQIEVAKNSGFSPIEHIISDISSTSTSISLEPDVDYYWRVQATDGEAKSSYSSVYKFFTYGVGETNQVPDAPEYVSSELDGLTVTLQWAAIDDDPADTLTYDVYFGTVNPPTATELKTENSNLTTASLSVEGLN